MFYNGSVSPPQAPGLVWKAGIAWALGQRIDTLILIAMKPFVGHQRKILQSEDKIYREDTQ